MLHPNLADAVENSSRQPSWNDVLDASTGAALRGVHTAMLGTIKSYNVTAQTAVVELATELPRASGEYAAVSPLEGSVVWPGAWSSGDRCLVVFLEESAAKWLETGSVEAPEILLRHGLHPVILPFPSIEGQTTQFVALANLVQTALDKIQYAFDNHTHATAAVGTPSPPIPIPAVVPVPVVPIVSTGPVAAAKVKAR